MTTVKISKYSLLAGALLLSLNAVAFENKEIIPIAIPVMDNASVFADFSDEMPAVLNYFTAATEKQIIDFYQQSFGEPISQERKRGRLTLSYQQEKQRMRVVISQQNVKRQVDIIIEKAEVDK